MGDETRDIDLLKLNYLNLHESVLNCHRMAWTVTEIFIPFLFGLLVYAAKETPSSLFQAAVISASAEALLFIWILTMRVLNHYNKVRIRRLRFIESKFVTICPDFAHYGGKMSGRYRKRLSPRAIYKIIAGVYTIANLMLPVGVWLDLW